VKTQEELRDLLEEIDNSGYGAYNELKGTFQVGHYTLAIDYVQGDPFASPSKARIRIPQYKAQFPEKLYNNKVRRTALEDFLARRTKSAIREVAEKHRGSGKSGMIAIDAGGQEVLERTACEVNDEYVELRLEIGLPAAGRRVLAKKQADAMLNRELPQIAADTLIWETLPQSEVWEFVQHVENQAHLRDRLEEHDLIAFVANGSILPRRTGADERPMEEDRAVKFNSPDSMEVTFDLPNSVEFNGEKISSITGMGIPEGVTLITGGGYHGKSTLLDTIELGIYNHIPGDGREYVLTNPDAVKIRSEDGRRVEKVDISSFIDGLPNEQDTERFYSGNASGSTSQASNIMEMLELGAQVLLVDEDTSATNFMIRDARMQSLVHKENEPITPYLDRVQELYDEYGVSTILVMGGSGDYFDVADQVIMMQNYNPVYVTDQAREIAEEYKSRRQEDSIDPFTEPAKRIPLKASLEEAKGRKNHIRIRPRGLYKIQFGREDIEMRFVEQMVDHSQTNTVGQSLRIILEELVDEETSLNELLDQIEYRFEEEGFGFLCPFDDEHPGNLAKVRKYEIAAALNRLRVLQVKQQEYDIEKL